jgi:hypothetical protein
MVGREPVGLAKKEGAHIAEPNMEVNIKCDVFII